MPEVSPKGDKKEVKLFHEVNNHYKVAREDLEQRIYRKNGFNDADRMFSSFLDEKSWPFRSVIFDPRPYTVILEKSARLIGNKPKGRLVPREGGDALGAQINNELLSFQWDDNSRLGETMLQKWIQMDQNTRKYGASFGLSKWKYEVRTIKGKKKTFYDGPDFVVCNPRDVLANPSYNSVQKWFQYREFSTLGELESVNDVARSKPVYKNLDILKESMTMESQARTSSRREVTYVNENKAIRGLNDYLGTDESNKTIELITEYRSDRWITFAPKYGVVVRDVDSPYDHGEIPVVLLRYYPLGDDLYGMNEFEPVSKILRAINALLSQYIDKKNVDLYGILMANPVNVRMHTLDFAPEAKWLMNNPGTDVVPWKGGTDSNSDISVSYNLLVGTLLNAWGEASQGYSQVNPTSDQGNVTATEIKDTAFTRNVRDNMNQLFLADALKKQIMFWHSMNQQFMFAGSAEKKRIIRIVGRDAVDFFNRAGMGDIRPTPEDAMMVAQGQMTMDQINPGPRFAVDVDGTEVPKFQPDEYGEGGNLIIEPGDLIGNYDYVPDIETMKAPSDDAIENKMMTMVATLTNPAILQGLAQEGFKPKFKDIMIRGFEATKVIKDAEALFEELKPQQPMMQNGTNPAIARGVAGPETGQPTQGPDATGGMVASPATLPPVANQPLMG